jgi:predicted ribonuclease YlaK
VQVSISFSPYFGHTDYPPHSVYRTKHYQKKVTSIGTQNYHKLCIIRIQTNYRGYITRKHYKQLLKQYYKSNATTINETLKKKFYEKEFLALHVKMDENMNTRNQQVNSLLQ